MFGHGGERCQNAQKHFIIYLTAKETHIFNIHFIPETLINFTLNDMNMFDRAHAFVPDHFIRHNTVKNIFLLINAKNAKQCRTLENTGFESDFIACHQNTL